MGGEPAPLCSAPLFGRSWPPPSPFWGALSPVLTPSECLPSTLSPEVGGLSAVSFTTLIYKGQSVVREQGRVGTVHHQAKTCHVGTDGLCARAWLASPSHLSSVPLSSLSLPSPRSPLLPRGNLLPNLTTADLKKCRFHPEEAPFCPILRVGDVVKFAGQNFTKLASTVRT